MTQDVKFGDYYIPNTVEIPWELEMGVAFQSVRARSTSAGTTARPLRDRHSATRWLDASHQGAVP